VPAELSLVDQLAAAMQELEADIAELQAIATSLRPRDGAARCRRGAIVRERDCRTARALRKRLT
jgi:hypothetical protein